MEREATCHCGQLRVTTQGEPLSVSLCNCHACQRRTGSAFGLQAAFSREQVSVTGTFKDFTRASEDGDRRDHVFHFCPECGSGVFQSEPLEPEFVIVPVGAFADPAFPAPAESHYDQQRHPWVRLPAALEQRNAALDAMNAHYAAGRYAEAAARGREILAEHPDDGKLVYNLACNECLAGERDAALEHLARAIEIWDGCRGLARADSDFDALREDPAFGDLVR